MATLARAVLTKVGVGSSAAANSGQAAGYQAASGGGDLVPISGQGTILRVKSTGTAVTVTIDSVAPSSYGTDVNPTLVLAATDEQEIFLANDGRWDQGGGNAGYASITYSQVVGVSVAAKQVP